MIQIKLPESKGSQMDSFGKSVGRAVFYSLVGCALVALTDIPTGVKASVFVVVAFLWELFCVTDMPGWRKLTYNLCVGAIGLLAVILIGCAINVHQDQCQRDHFTHCFARTLEKLDGPALALDKDGMILASNPAFRREWKYSEGDLVGREWRTLTAPGMSKEVDASLHELIGRLSSSNDPLSGTRQEGVVLMTKEGKAVTVNLDSLAFHLRDHYSRQVVVILLIRSVDQQVSE